MRLICPKCDAQYDIADDVIPEGGRDVQCSSCTHTWFQMEKHKLVNRSLIERPTKPERDVNDPPPKPADFSTRRPLDSSIADILREEAAREKADIPPPTLQAAPPPTSSGSTAERAEETRKRIAELTGETAYTPAAIAAAATGPVAEVARPASVVTGDTVSGGNQRSMPSIHEINATLSERAESVDLSGLTVAEQEEVVKRRGFRRGFVLMLLLIAILITPYFFVDEITEKFPQTQEYMDRYVVIVDDGRIWLNEQVQIVRVMAEDLIKRVSAPDDTSTEADPVVNTPAVADTPDPEN